MEKDTLGGLQNIETLINDIIINNFKVSTVVIERIP
jgi:hypothetical protein